jgi:hypothetical protein
MQGIVNLSIHNTSPKLPLSRPFAGLRPHPRGIEMQLGGGAQFQI